MIQLEETLDFLRLFADPTRARLALLLDGNELSVAEITQITQLPQSRVSTHLGKLREAGVVRDRRQGASTYYAISEGTMPEPVRSLWALVGESKDEPLMRADRTRCEEIVRARDKLGSWPESVAGQMERHYSPGRSWEATMLGLMSYIRLGDVLDAGSGDGAVASLLAPRSRTVTCLDKSPKLLDAAKERLAAQPNVRFAHADIHQLPFADGQFDHVLLLAVLTYAEAPVRAVREAARVLRPGGNLVISTLARHAHPEVTEPYGHVNQGFHPRTLRGWLARDAGLRVEHCEISSHERRPPHFAVISAFAHKPDKPQKEAP